MQFLFFVLHDRRFLEMRQVCGATKRSNTLCVCLMQALKKKIVYILGCLVSWVTNGTRAIFSEKVSAKPTNASHLGLIIELEERR